MNKLLLCMMMGIPALFEAGISYGQNFNMCAVTTVTSTSGNIYDPGGPSGNYYNSQSCNLLIDPGCAISITLTFSAFSLESSYDYLRIYDGTTTSDPLLLSASGSSIPSPVTANSGTMLLRFTTDGSVTYPGFASSFSSTIISIPPVANFSVSDSAPPLNVPVSFTDVTTNAPVSWAWDFGDGSNDSSQNPVHTYTIPGIYTVQLIATNCYSSDTTTSIVTVQGPASALVSPPYIADTVLCGDSAFSQLMVYNTGSGDLVYSLEGDGGGGGTPEVLALTYGVDLSTEYPNTIAAINQYFTNYNLTTINTTSAVALQAALTGVDVFLVPEQESGNATVFTGFASVLQSYVNNGGTVIMLGTSNQSGLYIFNSGLFTGTYQGAVFSGSLPVLNSTHPITSGFSPSILVQNATAYFDFTNVDAVPLVSYSGYDVVTYRLIGNGKVIHIGFDYFAYDNDAAMIIANAVQWGASGSLPGWLSVNPIADTVLSADSSMLTINLNASGLLAGTYTHQLLIVTNDSSNDTVVVPCTLTVVGQPLITLSANTINFGTLMVGTSGMDSITIYNDGCDSLVVSGIAPSSTDFIVSPGSFTIPSYDSAKVYITFLPSAVANYNDSMVIFNNDADTLVFLNGVGAPAPDILVNPDSLMVTMANCGDSVSLPLVISNTGGGTLNYNINGAGTGMMEVLALTYGVDLSTEYPNTIAAINQYFTNYNLTTINTTSAVALQAALTGVDVFLVPEQESGNATVFTGFASVLQSYVNNGGTVIMLGTSNQSGLYIFNSGLFTGTYQGAVFSGSLPVLNSTHPITSGFSPSILVQNATAYFDFTNVDAVPLVSYSGYDVVTYRLIGNGKVIHIGFDYFAYDNDAAMIIANAVQWGGSGILPSWISPSTLGDTVLPGDSSTINVIFNSTGLTNGVYTGSIVINSNDPDESPFTVICILTVAGQPLIGLSSNTISFGTLVVGNSISDSIMVYNNGCDSLMVGSIVPSSPVFVAVPGSFSIPPYDSAMVYVTFSPSAVANYADSMIIYNNDADTVVYLNGVGAPAPVIAFYPDSLSATLGCDDSVTITLNVINTGGSDLYYDIIGGGDLALEDVLSNMNANFTMVNSAIPSRYDFTNGVTGTNITDGGGDMYDGGNYLNTNLGTALSYSDNFIINSSAMGGSGRYFTRKYQGLFVFAADIDNVNYFEITGNLGADGSGNTDATILTYSTCGKTFKGFVKRVYNAGDPSVNHLVIVEDLPGISYTASTNTNDDQHRVTNLNGTSRIYYLLYAGSSGGYIGNAATLNIMTQFFNAIMSVCPSGYVSATPLSDTVSAGDTSVVSVTFNSTGLTAGQYVSELTFVTNDPANDTILLPCILTVAGTPVITLSDTCFNFGGAMVGDTLTDTLTITNDGCADLLVSSISATPSLNFSANPGTFSIPPDSSVEVVVSFIPTSITSYSGILTINNDAGNETLCLFGSGLAAPDIDDSPTSFSVTLASCSDSVTLPLFISNTGGATLNYTIDGGSGTIELLALTYGVDLSLEYPNTIAAIDQYFSNYNLTTVNTTSAATLQSALIGKDVFLIPEQESGSASVFSGFASVLLTFVNGGGTVIMLGTDNQSGLYIFNSGLFTGSYMGSNYGGGNMTVLNSAHPITSGFPGTIPSQNATTYFNFTNVDAVTLVTYSGYDVVTYRMVGSGKVIHIGYDFYDYDPYASQIIANAIAWGGYGSLPPWLTLSSLTDSVLPGDSSLIDVTFSSTGLSGGQYTGSIVINSNDPDENPLTVLCTLYVSNVPCADFIISSNSACTGAVGFTDSSSNAPTSWLWNFGDGGTSSLQNPTYSYAVSGTYQVQLVACNGFGCDTTVQGVTVINSGGPLTACMVNTNSYCCGMGIYNLTFNTINNTSNDGVDGYMDYSCTANTSVTIGQTYTISVQTGASYNENVNVWIDFNNNGSFEVGELVLSSLNKLMYHSGNVAIPTGAATNTALRMRVGSDYYSEPTPSPCTNVISGQFEDYTVIVMPNTIPPAADFSVQLLDACQGIVHFTDNSVPDATSWSWDFGDGVGASVQQNPYYAYTVSGTLTVTLIASNIYGSDTMTQTITVNLLDADFTASGTFEVGTVTSFTDNSMGATSWNWDFGDGYSANIQNPAHVYTAPGTYQVKLTVTNGSGCMAASIKDVVIAVVGIGETGSTGQLQIVPNPANNEVMVTYAFNGSRDLRITIENIIGQTVYSEEKINAVGYRMTLGLSSLPGGLYLVRINDGNGVIEQKLVVNH